MLDSSQNNAGYSFAQKCNNGKYSIKFQSNISRQTGQAISQQFRRVLVFSVKFTRSRACTGCVACGFIAAYRRLSHYILS